MPSGSGPGSQRVEDFGELVATAVFRRLKRYTVPVVKLRFKLDPNESQRLIDIVAFQHLARPGEVVLAVTEVKSRTNTPTPLPATLGPMVERGTPGLEPGIAGFGDRMGG